MTTTLIAVYLPIGFQGGLTGVLFTEFAFTLAGAVIVSGVVALTLSPMMCSVLLKHEQQGWFARKVDTVFTAVTNWYGRRLDRSLDFRSITALFAVLTLQMALKGFSIKETVGYAGLIVWPVYFVLPFSFAIMSLLYVADFIDDVRGRNERTQALEPHITVDEEGVSA